MICTETKLKGCFVLETEVFRDERGVFFETHNKRRLEASIGQKVDFVQDNHSVSKRGVLRGLHFQEGKYAQAKLVRVLRGEVLDIVVDLRQKSATFGRHFKLKLTGDNKKVIFIPKGMAHGFLTLSETAVFAYKCDNYYHKASERGLIYNDPTLQIDWEIAEKEIIVSSKDAVLPRFNELFI